MTPAAIALFERDGCLIVPQMLGAVELAKVDAAFAESVGGAGQRHLIDHPAVVALLRYRRLREVVYSVLSPSAFAFKATLFDKRSDANWLVAWHQDLSIPVIGRTADPGWRAWSTKEGVQYVQPPSEVLSRLLAVRINIDACSETGGPLQIIPGSHKANGPDVASVACIGRAGDAWLMRPLVQHASSKMSKGGRRRVLHLEFADFDLPAGLQWHRRISL